MLLTQCCERTSKSSPRDERPSRAVGGPASVDDVTGAPWTPDGWSADVVLADGGTVHLRPMRPDDGERLLAFHAALSAESVYYRYFSAKPRLTEAEVHRFTHVDHVDRVALVAVLGDAFVAVGRYDRWPGRDEAEVAFTVADAHHGRGMATALLEHLAAIVRTHGIATFSASVLPDNRAMLGVFRSAGFEVRRAFDAGVVELEFPIEPTAAYLESLDAREQRAESRSVARILRPRSVVVIGASDRAGSLGGAVIRNLVMGGYGGTIHVVHPAQDQVAGLPAVPSVREIADDVDLAVVAVPAGSVAEVLLACAARGVRSAVVLSAGLEGRGAELADLARSHGMRLVGPASLGVLNTGSGGGTPLVASFAPLPARPGPAALSVQSGPLGAALVELAYRVGLGVSSFVSLGDKADVSANDLLNYWYDQPATKVVLLYTETVGNPRRFVRVAGRVAQRTPIVGVKANRRGADDAAEALYRRAGVVRVDTAMQLVDTGRLLAFQPLPTGPRLLVVTDASSPGVLALGTAADDGLEPAALGDATVEALRRACPGVRVSAGMVDLGHRASVGDYVAALAVVARADEVHAVIVVRAPAMPGDEAEVAAAVEAVVLGKPVAAVVLGLPDGPLVPGGAVPNYGFPEPPARALSAAWRLARWRSRSHEEPEPPEGFDGAAVRAVAERLLVAAPAGRTVSGDDLAELLAAAGIAMAASRRVSSCDEAVVAGGELGYPVALRAVDPPLRGRSEAGGIALDVQDAAELRRVYERMRAQTGGLRSAVVQRMAPPGVETRLTLATHGTYGPMLHFGLGGLYADAIADGAPTALPLDEQAAGETVAASRAARALAVAGVTTDASVDLLVRVSALADAVWELADLDLNPVLVGAGGARVLDGRAHLAPAAPVALGDVREL